MVELTQCVFVDGEIVLTHLKPDNFFYIRLIVTGTVAIESMCLMTMSVTM